MLEDWLKNDKYILLAVSLLAIGVTTGFIANQWPSEFLVLLTGVISFAAIAICGKILPIGGDKIDKGIFVSLCTAGVFLNTIVRVANGGYMPVLRITESYKYWVPMSGAKLTWMSDWLVGDYSIGDMLIIIGLLWVIYCVGRYWMKIPG